MTSKRMITLLLAALMIAVSVVSVSAATLTPESPGGQTEVIAKIDGSNPPEPGDVTYKITIPATDLPSIKTFNDLYDYIEQHLPA